MALPLSLFIDISAGITHSADTNPVCCVKDFTNTMSGEPNVLFHMQAVLSLEAVKT